MDGGLKSSLQLICRVSDLNYYMLLVSNPNMRYYLNDRTRRKKPNYTATSSELQIHYVKQRIVVYSM